MALGGGTFTSMNKVLPGAYINVVSRLQANAALSDRGIAAVPMPLNYAPEGVFKVESGDLQKNCRAIFGCEYTADELKPVRDVFKNANTVYFYNVLGGGTAATNTYATAKYKGTNGNNLKIRIDANVDTADMFDVVTLLGNTVVDTQVIAKTATTTTDNKLKDNDFVTFKKNVAITATVAVTSLTGGTNAASADYQTALDKLESFAFNTLACTATDNTTKGLFAAYTKRMRDEIGVKFQTVIHDYAGADYEGVISVKNHVKGTSSSDTDYGALVYWVTGAAAGCAVNRSNTNKLYNGEYEVDTDYTQSELAAFIKGGYFVLHKVGDDVRVLVDRNSLLTYTDEKGELFNDNQVVRVADQIANDIATIFNTKYIGMVQNNASGRALFKSDIVSHHMQLQNKNAIEGFTSDAVTITPGNEKGAVVVSDVVTVVGTMAKLYMTVYVS